MHVQETCLKMKSFIQQKKEAKEQRFIINKILSVVGVQWLAF